MSKMSCSPEISEDATALEPVPGLTVKEAAYLLSMSPKTIYGWCAEGKISFFRIVGSIRIPLSSINFLLNSTFDDS